MEKKEKKKMADSENRHERLKKRRILLGVCIAAVAAFTVLVVMFALGYFEPMPNRTNLQVKENGRIVFEEVYDKGSKYDLADVKDFANKQIDAYNSKKGSRKVRFNRLWSDDGRICLKTVYDDAKTYADFTGLTLFCGTVGEARAEGYTFKDSFVTVGEQNAGTEVSAEEATKVDTNDILIIDQAIDIKHWESPAYICGAEGSVNEKGVISLKAPADDKKSKDSDTSVQTVIIFK